MNLNKGFSKILIIFFVFALIAVYFLAYFKSKNKQEAVKQTIENKTEKFEELKQTNNTPEEIDNAVIKELDDIFDSIDNIDEDLSGIE